MMGRVNENVRSGGRRIAPVLGILALLAAVIGGGGVLAERLRIPIDVRPIAITMTPSAAIGTTTPGGVAAVATPTTAANPTTAPTATLAATVAPTAAPTASPMPMAPTPTAAPTAEPPAPTTVPTVVATVVPPPPPPPTATPPPVAQRAPADLNITTTVVVPTPWGPVEVGVTRTLANDPRVAQVTLAYLRGYQVTGEAFATLDESRLPQVSTGPELERQLQTLARLRSEGRGIQVTTEHLISIYRITDDGAGIYDQIVETIAYVDPVTGQELQTFPPRRREIVVALRWEDGTWKSADGRTLR